MTTPRQTRWCRPRVPIALLLLAALAPSPAYAVDGVRCSLSVTSLDFGNYAPASSRPTDFTASITVICAASGAATAPIHATVGLMGAGGVSARQLANGTGRMRYRLYLDPARTAPWGNGSDDRASISGFVGPATPIRQTLTVYGRLLARQSDALVGAYTDQIVVVLDY